MTKPKSTKPWKAILIGAGISSVIGGGMGFIAGFTTEGLGVGIIVGWIVGEILGAAAHETNKANHS